MLPALNDRAYVGSIVATFLGGFLTAHVVLRLLQVKKSTPGAEEGSLTASLFRQPGSGKTERTSPPSTPARSELRDKCLSGESSSSRFFEEEDTQPPSAFSGVPHTNTANEAPHGRSPLQLGVLPAAISSALSSAAMLLDHEDKVPEMPLVRAPSGIPTDIQLPELVFGRQASGWLCSCERLPILPFSTYAPCRLLDVKPDSPENGTIFEGLRTIAAYYLRADSCSICECIKTFGLNDLLYSIAQLECKFKETLRSGHRSSEPSSIKPMYTVVEASRSRHAMIARAAEAAVGQAESPRPRRAAESENVRGVLCALMHELECILHEYLSFHWDRLDEIYDANRHLLRKEGPVCVWRSVASLSNLSGSSPRADSTASDSSANLADLDRPTFPDRLSHDGASPETPLPESLQALPSFMETFDDFMAKKAHSRTGSGSSTSRIEPARENGAAPSGSPNGRPAESHAKAETLQQPPLRRKKSARLTKAASDLSGSRKVTEDMLGPQRRFLTLTEMFEDMNKLHEPSVPQARQPIILLLGGGMAAGKSTVREIIGQDGFWSKVGKDAVIVEADAIKNEEPLLQSLMRYRDSYKEDDLLQHLHEYSTKKAETMLVRAVNEQKDIVFDGTMTWAPFVEQTITMIRDHEHNYKRGRGFSVDQEGVSSERYWEIDHNSSVDVSRKRPYRIELVGVTCDAGLAVARGIWRKIRTNRSVPVPSQLRSHRLFSSNFEKFASAVDSATLYHTGSALTTFNKGGVDLSPKVIAHRSSYTRGELLRNPAAYDSFMQKMHLVESATCRTELYRSKAPIDGLVPTTQEDQMSTLRHVFRAADRQERKALQKKPMPRRNSFW